MEPETSVNRLVWTERWPKSSRSASVIASLLSTRSPMARSIHSMRLAALGGPSLICAAFCRASTSRIRFWTSSPCLSIARTLPQMTVCQLKQRLHAPATPKPSQLTVSYEHLSQTGAKTVGARMQSYQQEREQALAKTALALMSEVGVAPTPDNFELFYTYASGGNPAMGEVIDRMISARRPFTSAVLDDLRTRCLSSARTTQALDNASSAVVATLNAILEKLDVAGRDAGDYGRALSRAGAELDAEHSPAELHRFVDTLVSATRTMEARTHTLEEELQRSSQQVNALKTQLEDVRKESLTDSLTAVANRKAFDAELLAAIAEARESGETVALLMVDIDHFKKFNDTWGHQTGDQVLRLVAGCMAENVKGRDTVARFGGEEFAVILRKTSLDNA